MFIGISWSRLYCVLRSSEYTERIVEAIFFLVERFVKALLVESAFMLNA